LHFLRRRSRLDSRRILLLLLVLLLVLNINRVGRALYPFPYRDVVSYYAQQYNLDPCLVAAIIKTESNFNPNALSRKGAIGLMQVMPPTGKWVAAEIGLSGFYPRQLYNPQVNIRIGCWYLSDLYREFNGDTVLVLAAYNGGRGNVKKWLTQVNRSKNPDKIDQLPFLETRQFIRKVLWNHKIYRFLYGREQSP